MRRLMVLFGAIAACAESYVLPPSPFPDLVRVSGASPFGEDCAGQLVGTVFRDAEVEPQLAVDPADARHLIAVWQQDRWTNGASNGVVAAVSFDGGTTWTAIPLPLSRCGSARLAAFYQKATDPWVTIGADGRAWAIALAFQPLVSAILTVRSDDGGRSWSAPTELIVDTDLSAKNDKPSIAADPTEPGRVYATWNRITAESRSTWLARTTGGVWEPLRLVDDGAKGGTVGPVIAVLPDGSLVLAFARGLEMAVISSTDHGATWSSSIVVAERDYGGVTAPKTNAVVRAGDGLPSIAADPRGGGVYVAWQQRFDGAGPDGIAIARSSDGGRTWSAPVRVNPDPAVAAFTPSVAVAEDGTVGVSYYDVRDDRAEDLDHFLAAAFLETSPDGGATFNEERLTTPFDLRTARVIDDEGDYFLGDYQALAAGGTSFVPLFAAPVASADPTDVFVRPLR